MAKKILIGITIIVLGIMLLLNNCDIHIFDWSFSVMWPIFIFILGIGEAIDNRKLNITSIILIVIGLYFFLYNLDIIQISFWSIIMPILLIIIGISLIFPKKKPDFVVSKKSDIDVCAIFSGIDNVCESDNFQSANVTAIFGGAELDLRKAKVKDDKCSCNSTVAFGGVDIKIPDDWQVNTDGVTCIFGGVSDSRKIRAEKCKNTLYLTGTVVFGGIDIK